MKLRRWHVSYWHVTPLRSVIEVGETVVQARTRRGALRAAQALRRVPSWNVAITEVRS